MTSQDDFLPRKHFQFSDLKKNVTGTILLYAAINNKSLEVTIGSKFNAWQARYDYSYF